MADDSRLYYIVLFTATNVLTGVLISLLLSTENQVSHQLKKLFRRHTDERCSDGDSNCVNKTISVSVNALNACVRLLSRPGATYLPLYRPDDDIIDAVWQLDLVSKVTELCRYEVAYRQQTERLEVAVKSLEETVVKLQDGIQPRRNLERKFLDLYWLEEHK